MKFSFESKQFIEKETRPNQLAVIGEDGELTWTQFEQKVEGFVHIL